MKSKFFLEAPWAPECTIFEGVISAEKTRFFVETFQQMLKTASSSRNSLQRRKFGSYDHSSIQAELRKTQNNWPETTL